MLKTDNLVLGYGDRYIVKDIGLHVEKGDLITIIGVNGSGKSTLLKAMSRSIKPLKGMVYLNGKSIFKQDPREVAKKLAILPQMPHVPDDFTVRDLVSYGRYPYHGWNNQMSQEDFKIVDWAIEVTKIQYLQHRMVSTLSGGERQRAWIALALAQQPEILLLDEPTTFLDISYQFEILELIRKLNQKLDLTIVMVLHDLNQAARYSKKIVILKDGKIYKSGSPSEIINKEILEDVFNINVKVFNDDENNCPYFIPISSVEESGMDKILL